MAAGAQRLPGGFVYLRDIDPTIIQDIRYAGSNNFVGHPLAGYAAAECVVKREVARGAATHPGGAGAAKAVAENVRLLPAATRGRRHGGVVAGTAGKPPAGRRYNPAFRKQDLFRLGYIAERSGHSTGAALDLTLVDLKADNSAAFDPNKAYADCTAPAEARAPEGSVDMGTGYDCSDREGAHRRTLDHARAAPVAEDARRRHGEAGFRKLFEGVVALFAAGRGRAGL